jgi:predicted dienelactone hydrolase
MNAARKVGSGVLVAWSVALASGGCEAGTSSPSASSTAGVAAAQRADFAWAVDKPGPFRAGFRTWKHTYTPVETGQPRTIALNLWYPTSDTQGKPASYMDDTVGDAEAFDQAKLAPPADPSGYPVMVYSHGYLGFGGTSADLSRHFASHGWVVIAPDHTGNTLAEYATGGNEPPPAIWYLRTRDLQQCLKVLDELPANDPLHGKASTKQVVLSGHSFGAYDVWAMAGATYDVAAIAANCKQGKGPGGACSEADVAVFAKGLGDPRVAVAIPMAGGVDLSMWGENGRKSVKVPTLIMSGTDDGPGTGQPVFDRTPGPDVAWLQIENGCHQTFALGTCPKLSADKGFLLVNSYALAWARAYLLGDATKTVQGLVDGTLTLAPEGKLSRHP